MIRNEKEKASRFMTEIEKHISESAFLVNESRARNVALSQDRFASLWVSDSTRELWEDFTRTVYPYDDIELGVRNRYFLERLNDQINSGQISTFVNIGAGFTSYPFLINNPCRCVEVDFDHILRYKQKKISSWQNAGKMPERPIIYISADLSDSADVQSLESKLGSILSGASSFILLEGITYYLKTDDLQSLLGLFSDLQPPGSVLAFDFWKPDFTDHPVTARFKKFFADRFGHAEIDYNLFDEDFVRSRPGYEVLEITNVQEQERALSGTNILADYDQILPEYYALLRKQ
jgi:O-methyltransferase involved in polyketide biosynthesis